MPFVLEEAKWQLLEPRKLNLIGTQIVIVYSRELGTIMPYHVHRDTACHVQTDSLEEAKQLALIVVNELMEMGVDP
jgi:hypothetical protein